MSQPRRKPDTAADLLCAHPGAVRVRVGAGTVVLAPDQPPALLTLREGWAVRCRHLPGGDRHVIDVVLPGDVVGVDAVIAGRADHAVETLTGASLCRLPGVDPLAGDPALLAALLAEAVGQTRRAEAMLTNVCRREAPQRMAWFTLHLLGRLEARGLAQGSWVPFPLRRHHVADALGISPTHVSRTLAELHAKGLAQLEGGFLSVLDRAGLAALCGYEGDDSSAARPPAAADSTVATSSPGV